MFKKHNRSCNIKHSVVRSIVVHLQHSVQHIESEASMTDQKERVGRGRPPFLPTEQQVETFIQKAADVRKSLLCIWEEMKKECGITVSLLTFRRALYDPTVQLGLVFRRAHGGGSKKRFDPSNLSDSMTIDLVTSILSGKATLEEVGKRYKVTRERVRQWANQIICAQQRPEEPDLLPAIDRVFATIPSDQRFYSLYAVQTILALDRKIVHRLIAEYNS